MFRAGDGLQSRELNEIQTTLIHRLQGVADALLKDGDIVSGANLQIDADTGPGDPGGRVASICAARCARCRLPVSPSRSMAAWPSACASPPAPSPNSKTPTCANPPSACATTRSRGRAAAGETLAWGWEGAGTSDGQPGDFHAVYALDNGLLENRRQPPVLDGVIASLARYDYDANGHYVDRRAGRALFSAPTPMPKSTSSGGGGPRQHRRLQGRRSQSQRLRLPIDPDLQRVSSEPQVFNDAGDGSMVVTINRRRWRRCSTSRSPSRRPRRWSHGAFTGSRDVLTEPRWFAVLEVKQGGTTYAQGTDYKVVGVRSTGARRR